VHGVRGGAHVVGVDQQRVRSEHGRGAGLAGEDERAAVVRQDGALLGDEVHAVADGVHHQHVGEAAGGERSRVVVFHLQDQRVPVRGAELVGDLPRHPPYLFGVFPVPGHAGP
jgi:hypothetical protein